MPRMWIADDHRQSTSLPEQLTVCYFVLLRREPYRELGPDYLDQQSKIV